MRGRRAGNRAAGGPGEGWRACVIDTFGFLIA